MQHLRRRYACDYLTAECERRSPRKKGKGGGLMVNVERLKRNNRHDDKLNEGTLERTFHLYPRHGILIKTTLMTSHPAGVRRSIVALLVRIQICPRT